MHTSFINSEGSLADAFIDRYKDELRYGCKERRWYLRTPEGWVLDDTDLVFDMVRQFCREVGRDKERSDREWLNRARTYRSVLLIARSYREIAVACIEDEIMSDEKATIN